MAAAGAATFRRPGRWPLSLAGFLLRGGIAVIVVPIVIVPTPSGIANAVGPTLTGFVFGGPSPSFIALVAGVVAAAVGWLVIAGLLAAWLEIAAIRDVAEDEELPNVGPRRGAVGRVLAAHLLAHVPLAIALAIGAVRVGEATYEELIFPGDATTPLVVRVVERVPDAVVLIVVLWLLGEAVGGVAARRVAAGGAGAIRAVGGAAYGLVRRPTSLATAILGDLAVAAVTAPAVIAAALTWDRVRVVLGGPSIPGDVLSALVLFVAIWTAGLALLGSATTFRAAACTIDALRNPTGRPGTVGSGAPARAGDWPDGDGSGTLSS